MSALPLAAPPDFDPTPHTLESALAENARLRVRVAELERENKEWRRRDWLMRRALGNEFLPAGEKLTMFGAILGYEQEQKKGIEAPNGELPVPKTFIATISGQSTETVKTNLDRLQALGFLEVRTEKPHHVLKENDKGEKEPSVECTTYLRFEAPSPQEVWEKAAIIGENREEVLGKRKPGGPPKDGHVIRNANGTFRGICPNCKAKGTLVKKTTIYCTSCQHVVDEGKEEPIPVEQEPPVPQVAVPEVAVQIEKYGAATCGTGDLADGLEDLEPDGSGGLNHSPQEVVTSEELPEDLKRFARINEARTNEGAAYAYVAAGFRVFPVYGVRPDGTCACQQTDCDDVGKHPCYEAGLIEHGCLDATTDRERIRAWWRRWPDASIGCATDGYAVFDPDVPEKAGDPDGLAAWHEFRERYQLEATLTARTGGGGLHAVYTVPDGVVIGNSSAGLPPGIHVRGARGYIVVSPSVHKSGHKYEWIDIRPVAPLPQVLIDLLTPKPPQPVERRTLPPRGAITTGSPLYKGQRNEELARVAGAFAGKCGLDEEGVIQALLAANESRCKPPLPEGEVVKIARSISRKERAEGGLAFTSRRDVPRQPPSVSPARTPADQQPAKPPAPVLSRGCYNAHHKRVYLNDSGQSLCATCWPPPPNSATEVYELS